ncbi:MAG TPA: class I SAM-dependent methyltransferase [Verrucomicrobiae bacterium]
MNRIKRLWRRWNILSYWNGNPKAIDRLYLMEDPWNLNTAGEHFRFKETANFIRRHIGENLGAILEVGCGEGLQTEVLAPLATRIVGIDPSANAIARAKKRAIPNSSFEVGNLSDYITGANRKFDLVTACEVLYYFPDTESAYQKLCSLGKCSLVTYYEGVADKLDPFFLAKGHRLSTIKQGTSIWNVVWWKNEAA